MMIERIGSVDPIQPGKKASKNEALRSNSASDSVSVSSEAAEKAEIYRAMDLVGSAADVRADRIAELKLKMADPGYINDALISATADQIMTSFGL